MKERLTRKYLEEFVYGGVDGAVTTFAVVAGAMGASFGAAVVLILGFANLIADGFSMSVSNYLSVESERELHARHGHAKIIGKKPFNSAFATFLSFVLIGFIPLLFFVLAFLFPELHGIEFAFSIALTALALFFVGFVKGEVVGKHKVRSAIETLLIGGIAAAIAYFAGYLLSGLF